MADPFRQRVRELLDLEVAELELMRARFAALPASPMQAMAGVCQWTKERVELLREKVRLLEHDPEVRRG